MTLVHPGRILKRELAARSVSANKLASALRVPLGASDLFANVHLGTELHSFIVANLGNRTTITHDLPRDPRLESAHFSLQSTSYRINQRLPKAFYQMCDELPTVPEPRSLSFLRPSISRRGPMTTSTSPAART